MAAVKRSSRHTPEALKVLEGLDAELARSGARHGRTLAWTAEEARLREMIAATIDRQVRLTRLYEDTDPDDVKNVVRLSTEIRQLDAAVGRMLRAVRTDVPAPESLRTVKARRAANVRWNRGRDAAV